MAARKPIRVLVNSSEIIQVLSERGPLTPAEIGEAVGVPRPTAYRLAGALAAVGLASAGPDGRIALNLRLLHLADTALAAMTEWRASRAVLDTLAEATEQTAFLSVPRGDEAVCIDWAPGRGIGVLILKPGRALPFHAGAAGRTMLAHVDDPAPYLARAPFPQLTPTTLTTEAELLADRERSRADGYTVSEEDATVGIGALGMPILSPAGVLVGALSIGGLARDLQENRAAYLESLSVAAADLTASYAAASRA